MRPAAMERPRFAALYAVYIYCFMSRCRGTTPEPNHQSGSVSPEPLQSLRTVPEETYAFENQTVVLTCAVDNKVGRLHWKKAGVKISNEGRVLNGDDRLSIVGDNESGVFNLQISPARLTDTGSYYCAVMSVGEQPWLLSESVDLNICKASMCYVELGLYQCRCTDVISRRNTSEITSVSMSPMNTTTEAFEVFLTDGTSTCDCFRCGMDIDIDTGRDLLQCFNQDTINGNKCPPPLNGSAWHQRFTEISAINAQGATDGVILDNFKAVLKQGVSTIIDKSTESNFTFCHAECSDTVRQVDAFGLHLIQEIHDRYIGNKTIVIEMEYADLGITIELSSLFSEDVQEYIFPSNASPQDADTIRLPRQVLPSGTGYLVNVKYAEPRVVMETANINVEGRSLQSIILSSTVYPKPLFPLPDNAPVKLAFQHRDLLNASVKDVSCEFIEYGGPDGLTATWNSTGCVVHSTSQAVTVCHCNHLTSFGVLVRLREFEVAPIHATSLELISVIGCGISLFTIVMTLLTFALLGLCTNERIIHGNLCVAIGLGQIVFLAGIGQTRNKIACTAVSALLHYFFTSVFCWMLVEGIQIYLQLVVVFNTALKKRFVVYHLTGWGVPFVVVAISVGIGHGNYVSDQSCWLPIQHGMIYAFVGPVLAIVLFNMAILGITVRIISRLLANTTEDKYANIRSSLKAAIILFPLLGMTWLFGLLSVSRHTIFFEYVFAILNSLQGFFIFIFYCWNSTEVRSQLSRKRATFLIDREYSGSVRGWSTFSMTANRVKPSPPTSSTSVNRD